MNYAYIGSFTTPERGGSGSGGIRDDGRLCNPKWYCENIAKPRYFTISESGERLYCANEETHCISEYSVCPDDGRLGFINIVMKAGAPACILFR